MAQQTKKTRKTTRRDQPRKRRARPRTKRTTTTRERCSKRKQRRKGQKRKRTSRLQKRSAEEEDVEVEEAAAAVEELLLELEETTAAEDEAAEDEGAAVDDGKADDEDEESLPVELLAAVEELLPLLLLELELLACGQVARYSPSAHICTGTTGPANDALKPCACSCTNRDEDGTASCASRVADSDCTVGAPAVVSGSRVTGSMDSSADTCSKRREEGAAGVYAWLSPTFTRESSMCSPLAMFSPMAARMLGVKEDGAPANTICSCSGCVLASSPLCSSELPLPLRPTPSPTASAITTASVSRMRPTIFG